MQSILLDLPTPMTTPRLLLRPPQIGDGPIVNAAMLESLHTLITFMPWAKEIPTLEDSEKFVRKAAANWILKRNKEPYLPLFIFNKETHQFMGSAGYHHLNWKVPSVETGYWLRNSCVGQGYMTEAVNAITQYAFKQLHVTRISITCDVTNIRSKKIPERLGYTLEATLKANRRTLLTGEVGDTFVYAKYDLSGLPELPVNW